MRFSTFIGVLALLLAAVFAYPRLMEAVAIASIQPEDPEQPTADDAAETLASTIGVRPALVDDIPPPPAERRRIEREAPKPSEIVAAPETGASLGWGWNAFHSEALPTVCVSFRPEQPFTGQDTDLTFREIRDSFDMSVATSASVKGELKTIAYKVEGEASMSASLNVNSSSVTYLISAEVLNAPHIAGPYLPEGGTNYVSVQLLPFAEALARRDIEEFKDTCGSGFISATMGGARLTATAELKTQSTASQTAVRGEISGEAAWGAKASAAMSREFKSGNEKIEREIKFHQSGGRGQDLPTDAEGLLERVRELAKAADEDEKVFRIAVTPYEALRNWPRSELITGDAREVEELVALFASYRNLFTDLEDVMATPEDYRVPVRNTAGVTFVPATDALPAIGRLQDEVLAVLDRLEIAARRCMEAEEDCNTDLRIYRSPYALAVRMPLHRCMMIELAEDEECPAPDSNPKDAANPLDIFVDQLLRQPAKNRCAISTLTPGCISNAAIEAWRERVGMVSVAVPSETHVDTLSEIDELEFLPRDPETQTTTTLWFSANNQQSIIDAALQLEDEGLTAALKRQLGF